MDRLRMVNDGSSTDGDHPQHFTSNNSAFQNNANSVLIHASTRIGNVSNTYNTVYITSSVAEKQHLQIQEWLSPLEARRRHEDVATRRLDGVGNWVLQRDEFQSWSKGQGGSVNPILLCYGGQGVGKTYISSLIIDTLCDRARGMDIIVSCLYCDYQMQKQQSATNIIGSLLWQVALGAAQIPAEIKSAFDSKQRGSQGLRLPDMVELFAKVIGSMRQVFVCIDAVDELLPRYRPELLRALQAILQCSPNMRLFLTGRPYLQKELGRHLYLTERAYIINIVTDRGDLTRYISRKLEDDDGLDSGLMTESLRNDIIQTILEKASEMFQLAALSIDAILGETSLARRKEMLQKVATTGVDLGSAYAQTLQRIRAQGGARARLAIEALMWVSHSARPLRADELCHALAVEMESTDLDPDKIPSQDTVLASCFGLVVTGEETCTVSLNHYTLQEYLSHPDILPDAHKTLAQKCLTYLNYERVKALPADRFPNLLAMPFLQYSASYWGGHAKFQLSDHAKSLALKLLTRYGSHISATLLFNQIQSPDFPSVTSYIFNGLHCASYFGIVEVVAALIEMKCCNINQRDSMGFTPFEWAARRGNEGVVELLLTRNDINPDTPGKYDRTPIWWASMNGHGGVVTLLLKRDDVNPDRPDSDGKTPLQCAALNGNELVMGLLLRRHDVNPDKPDNYGRTLLWHASRSGKKELVRLLLTRNDVNPDKPDNIGRTPLLIASMRGHREIVALLQLRINKSPG